jgi:YbgC/YbaW family acyl-CoA thioester hydrolase
MKRQDFRFTHRLCVRWAEVDMQKIVFNAHYLMYFDTAVADYWRALALPYDESFAALGGELYVKKATVEYHGSARNDDQLDVALRCEHVGRSSMRFVGAIFRGERLLITGELIYVFADPATQTSRPVPDALRALLQDYESGEAVTSLALGDWQTLEEPARGVRTEVFIEEQGIAAADEWDADDGGALHAVLRNRLGHAVAVARLLQPAPGVAQIGRMAVRPMLRGAGWGALVLQALVQAARERGDHEVTLHAQRSAEGFYRRLGFVVRGEPFDEVGIAHVHMVLPLQSAQMSSSSA